MFFQSTLYDSYFLPMLIKVLLAAVAGGIIGWEREMHGRPAGLRTHLLVSVGACLMMIVSEGVVVKYADLLASGIVRIDPSRIAAQVVTGIGFLGAGVIIKEGMSVRGLTTAASLWVMSGIGMAFGLGMVSAGILCTAVASAVLIILKKMDHVVKKDRFLRLIVAAESQCDLMPHLQKIFTDKQLNVMNLEQELNIEEQRAVYEFVLTRQHPGVGQELVALISTIDGVKKVRYK